MRRTPNGSEPIKRYFAKSRSIILEGETAYRIGIREAHGLIPPDRNSGARESIRDYSTRHPGPADLALAVEVADSSLDRMQADIYGRAGIPVYWIINLIDRQVEVYLNPDPSGYQSLEVFVPPQVLTVLIDGVEVGEIPVAEILP